MRPTITLFAAIALAAPAIPAFAQANVGTQAQLRHFDVTVRRFDPVRGPASGESFVLPVDSPDEEHAAASTLANAISFSRKTQDGHALPVAFMVVRVTQRQ